MFVSRAWKSQWANVIGATQTKLTTPKICFDLFSQRENKLKFCCSFLDISLAEEKMLESIVSVLVIG